MSWQRSLVVWLLAVPLYLFVCLEHVERHFGRHPHVYLTVMIAVSMACWIGATRWYPRMLMPIALFAPLVGAAAGLYVIRLVHWAEVGRLSPLFDVLGEIGGWLMAITLSKALLLSLLVLVAAFWEAKGRIWVSGR